MRISCLPRRLVRLAALACLLSLVGAPEGRGELTTYQYGGAISRADASTGVAAGTRFSGTFAYDLAAGPARFYDVPDGRCYDYGTISGVPVTSDVTGLDSTVGGQSILQRWGDLSLNVYGPGAFGDGPGSPQAYLSIGASDTLGSGGLSVQLLFLNTERAVYPTLDAPGRINLDDFTAARFEVMRDLGRGRYQLLYEGVIDSLVAGASPAVAPEPSSAFLLGTAAGASVLLGRWRRRVAGRTVNPVRR